MFGHKECTELLRLQDAAHGVRCVVLRHKRPNMAFSADVRDEAADGSVAFELTSWTVLTSKRFFDGDCVWRLNVDPPLTWTTVV